MFLDSRPDRAGSWQHFGLSGGVDAFAMNLGGRTDGLRADVAKPQAKLTILSHDERKCVF